MSSSLAVGAVSSRAMLTELLPLNNRGKVLGRYMAIVSSGRIIGPVIGGFLAENIGYKTPYYLSGSIGILVLFVLAYLSYNESTNKTFHSKKSQLLSGFKMISTLKKAIFIILFIRLLFMFNMHFQRIIIPILLYESPIFRASETQIGLYLGVVSFSAALSQVFLGHISDIIGSKKILIIGLLMGGLSYLSLNILQNITPLYIVGVFQGIFSLPAN